MIRRINYTKRVKIKSESVDISVRAVSGAAPVATATVRLEEYKLPPDAEVVVEAYRKASYARERMGTVAAMPDRFEFALREFDSPEGVRFRLKVVGKREDAGKDAPLLLGIADRISPNEGDDQDLDYDKLLRLVPAELNGEVWRIDLEDGPVVQIERAYWDERSFVRTGWFFAMVIPTVLREALRAALADNYRDIEDEDWRSRWLRFALTIPGERELPAAGNDIEEWIDSRVEAFCRQQKMRERFEAVMRGAD